MEVKIDTKEKFTVVTPLSANLSANMSAEFIKKCEDLLHEPIKNIVLKMSEVSEIDEEVAIAITHLQHEFYENSASFVICNISEAVEAVLEKLELAELWNITPSESEAWDIVQMEEIERELLDGDDINFETNA